MGCCCCLGIGSLAPLNVRLFAKYELVTKYYEQLSDVQ